MGAQLDNDTLDTLIAQAIAAGLSEAERRSLLLARLAPEVRASLQRFSRSSDQLRGDVYELNRLGLLDAWLLAARQLAPGFEAGANPSVGPAASPATDRAQPDRAQPDPASGAVAAEGWSVLVVNAANDKLLGSGVIIDPRLILTADHVVAKMERCAVRLKTDGEPFAATVAWRSVDLDVALLRTDAVIDPTARIVQRARVGIIPGDTYWQAYGYPALYAKNPSERLQQEGGRTHFWATGSTLPLALTIQGGPKGERALNGLSGAGVLVDDRVVAIITGFEAARQQARIDAVPLARFFADPRFRVAAGLSGASASNRRWLALRAMMLRVLGVPVVRQTFVAKLGGVAGDAEAVLNALLQQAAVDALRVFNHACAALGRTAPRHAADVRALMLALVPWVADLRALREAQMAALHAGECCFDLPCRNGLLIDALMAGMGPRAMAAPDALRAGDGGPQLRLSSIAYAPVADADGSAAVDGVVRELAWVEGIDEDDKTPAQLLDAVLKRLQGVLEDPDDPLDQDSLVEEVEDLLQQAADRPDNPFHYYLFFDVQDANTVLAQNRQALRKALPGLWLVRSTSRYKAERRMVKDLKDAAAALQKAMPTDD